MNPVQGQVIRCIALRRPSKDYGLQLPDWMLCTGVNMGRWTSWFGPWCLAGDGDATEFVKNNREMHSGSEIVEFEIHCTSSLLLLANPEHEWVCSCGEKNAVDRDKNPFSQCGRCGALK